MKIMPLVSIITPCFNAVRFVNETIESVHLQDYPLIEHIIVDGGSDDGTQDILKRYPHLRWISEPDTGQSQALNKGFRMAQGEIIGWLNADDTYTPGAVAFAVDHLMEHPDVDMVCSDQQIVDGNSLPVKLSQGKPFDLITHFTENYVRQPTVFFRRKIIDLLGGVDENLHFSMDREFWLRIGSKYKIQYLPNHISANFRLCEGTKTFLHKPKFQMEWLGVLERSVSDPRYQHIPLSVKRYAIQKYQVGFRVASMEQAIATRDTKCVLYHFWILVTRNWDYILKYPFRKLSRLGQV